MRPAYLYAVEFSGRLLKVGRATFPATRIKQHAGRLAVADIWLINQYVRECSGSANEAEQSLIAACTQSFGTPRLKEWFAAADFELACDYVDTACGFSERKAPEASASPCKPVYESAIAELVAHHGGPTALARLLGAATAYQTVQKWTTRNWASPMYIAKLEPLLPPGMTIHDLFADRERVVGQEMAA